MTASGPYHEGEIAIQEKVGERVAAEMNGRVIAPVIPKGAVSFLAQQQMLVLASVDASDQPWASVLVGPAGFAQSPDTATVQIDTTQAPIGDHDPLLENLVQNPQVGMLAIEFDRRRRLRINGTVVDSTSGQIEINVNEAYPNCPKYIQRRHLQSTSSRSSNGDYQLGDGLTEEQVDLIRRADTMFVASVHPQRGADASHRGGLPGFVSVPEESTIRIPDYLGNSMYNTLGNISVNPLAGVLFLDFDTSRVLQLTGSASLIFDDADASEVTGGTGRFWQLAIKEWRQWDLGFVMQWEQLDASPHSPKVLDQPSEPNRAAK